MKNLAKYAKGQGRHLEVREDTGLSGEKPAGADALRQLSAKFRPLWVPILSGAVLRPPEKETRGTV